MSKTTEYFCDLCGNKIEGDNHSYRGAGLEYCALSIIGLSDKAAHAHAHWLCIHNLAYALEKFQKKNEHEPSEDTESTPQNLVSRDCLMR